MNIKEVEFLDISADLVIYILIVYVITRPIEKFCYYKTTHFDLSGAISFLNNLTNVQIYNLPVFVL